LAREYFTSTLFDHQGVTEIVTWRHVAYLMTLVCVHLVFYKNTDLLGRLGEKWSPALQGFAAGSMLVGVLSLKTIGTAPFIYFQF
jgi:hypothetical protein